MLVGIIAYLLILLAIGAIASRRMKDVRDYFVAGKRLSYWAVAFSARATGESGWLLLGLTGMGAAVGLQAMWIMVGETIGVGAAWMLMSRRFKNLTDRYDAITIPDYLESRFRDSGHLLRMVSAGALTFFVTIYVSAQIDATGQAFEDFLGWNYYTGALAGFGVVLLYITAGGFLAVAWSDVFQGGLMFIGLVSLPIVGLVAAGGPGPVIEGLRAIDPTLLSPWGSDGLTLTSIATIIGFLCIGIGYLGSPQIFVRYIALRSPREIRAGTIVAITWTLFADTGAVLVGMVGRYLFTSPGQDVTSALGEAAEGVLPEMVSELLPVLLVGVFIAVVLAAIMSTVDSLLVVAGSAAVRDYYQKVFHPDLPDDALVGLSRKATVGLAMVALALALTVAVLSPSRSVFWFVIFGWSGIAASFCPTIILSLFWSRMTARGALAAMIIGFLSVPFFRFVAPTLPAVGDWFAALSELPPAFAVSFVVGVLVSLTDRSSRAMAAKVGAELSEAASNPLD